MLDWFGLERWTGLLWNGGLIWLGICTIYTNGDKWLVQRRIGDDWVPVNDLPDFNHLETSRSFEEIAYSCSQLLPVLYWLDQPVPAKFASIYFDALQRIFGSRNYAFTGTDEKLLGVLDNLLRVLPEIRNAEGYISQKIGVVYRSLKSYGDDHGAPMMPFLDGTPANVAHDCIRVLALHLPNSKGLQSMDLAAMRLIECFLRYFYGISHNLQYRDIEADIQQHLRSYLDMGLRLNLNSSLPEISDIDGIKSLRSLCEPLWNYRVKTQNG
jgi:hypothetical protein